MRLIDPHTHSSESDGTQRPAELMAAAAGLDVLGLTDHDTWRGWDEAARATTTTGVSLLRGVELSTAVGGVSVHLLSYLHDPDDALLLAEATASRDSRLDRARRMVASIGRDLDLSWEDVAAQLSDGATVGRPHIADALVARGHVADRSAAFADILNPRGPYYVRYYAPDTVDAVRMVRAAGGVPVMAHPRAAARGRVVSDGVIGELAAAGLAGLEVDHRDHSEEAKEELRALAQRLGLFITGASDYHGAGKPNVLAENTTAPAVLEQILDEGYLDLVTP